MMLLLPASLHAQSVSLDGPTATVLPSITPALQFRASGLASARPLQVTVALWGIAILMVFYLF